MFACGKMPMRTFSKATAAQFPACEDCRSIFPSETEMSVGGLVGSMMLRLGKIPIKEGLPGLSPGVL